MKTGYGLSNYWSIDEGFVYHGHDGGVDGGLTEMAYMPDHGVGYFYSINSGNGDAFEKIGKAIRAYITNKLEKPALPAAAALPANAADYEGWYEADSPRVEVAHFLERLTRLNRVRMQDGKLVISSLREMHDTYVPVTGSQFRHEHKEDSDPVASLELITPNADGRFIQNGLGDTMKKIPTWFAITEILAVAWFVIAVFCIVIYAPFWMLGGLFKARRRPAERAMRFFPLLSVLSLVAFVGTFILSVDDLITRLGNMTAYSVSLWATTLFFAITALAGALVALRSPEEGVRRGVRRFSIFVSLPLLIAAIYLTYWGIIGVRTWA